MTGRWRSLSRGMLLLLASLVVLGLPLLGCGGDPAEREAVRELMALRTEKDRFMASADSPLTPEQRGRFKGLAYFNPDFDLVFESALQVHDEPDTVRMLTTTGGIDAYLRYAVFPFTYDGAAHQLTVFRALDGPLLFLPFTDTTSGDESYGAARYIDLLPLEDTNDAVRFRLDFNRAYNPFCAYNPEWACPIAPPENALRFAVRAGERRYPYGPDAP